MKNYPSREIWRNFFSVVAGVLAALLVLLFCGYGMHTIDTCNYKIDPAYYDVVVSSFIEEHTWNEVAALTGGFFIGGLIASFISTRKNLLHALLVPPVVLLFYPSIIGRELAFLALPLWMFIALLAWKLSEWIKEKRKRKIPG
jgi:hypothetical protein